MDFDSAIENVTKALGEQGFGVVTEMNITAIFKNKLDKDFRNYRILGACNPPQAFKSIEIDDKIGTLLPCNVVLQEIEGDLIEVSAIDPNAYLDIIRNDAMTEVMDLIHQRLKNALDSI